MPIMKPEIDHYRNFINPLLTSLLDPICRRSRPHAQHWRPSPDLRLPAHFQGHHRLLRCPLLLPICRFLALCLHQKSRQKRVKVILFYRETLHTSS